MAKTKNQLIREAPLTNNCPECFNQDLTLSYYQVHAFSRLYHRVRKGIQRELRCNTCKSILYPVNWTDDIERSVEYYEKAIVPEQAGIRFKPLFYILILLAISLVGAGIYLYLQGAPEV